jgi:hypothetical protein
MITLNFYTAVSAYLFFCISMSLGTWVVARREKHKKLSLDQRFIWFCSVCTYTYVNTKEDVLSVCPRCGSYNKKEGSLSTVKNQLT